MTGAAESPEHESSNVPPADDGSARASSLPGSVRVAGLALAAAAFAPLSPDGTAFWQLARQSFEWGAVPGLMVTFGYGAPFWFGLALAVGGGRPSTALEAPTDGIWSKATRMVLALMHAQLVLTAWTMARAGMGVAPWSLVGFACVSGLYFTVRSGRFAADSENMEGAPPPPWWLARWGATMIVGICGWLRLQSLAGLRLGWALELAAVAALLVSWRMSRRRG